MNFNVSEICHYLFKIIYVDRFQCFYSKSFISVNSDNMLIKRVMTSKMEKISDKYNNKTINLTEIFKSELFVLFYRIEYKWILSSFALNKGLSSVSVN